MNKTNLKLAVRNIMFENESIDITEIKDLEDGDELLEELMTSIEEDDNSQIEFNDTMIESLKNAYMAGFMKSDENFNGSHAKMRYRESVLKPGSVIWNENLKTGFNRFLYNEKKKYNQGK